MDDDRQHTWDERYRRVAGAPRPARVLVECAHLLPVHGLALDLACGLGANAVFMAQRGLTVCAWDLSPVAIERLRQEARKRRLDVSPRVRDLVAHPPAPDSFDVICVGRFLDRGICPAIAAALRPGGLLFYQTYTRAAVDAGGPSNPAYRLETNELLRLFSGLTIRVYRDEGLRGDLGAGLRNEAMVVAERSG